LRSIVDLQAALNRYIADHRKPSTRTKPADQVLANPLDASEHYSAFDFLTIS
jgi:hypothetical protein